MKIRDGENKFMSESKRYNLEKYSSLVSDYKSIVPNRSNKEKKTYYQLTVAMMEKLKKMLVSGHRLCRKNGKKLLLRKEATDKNFYRYMNPHPLARLIKSSLRAIEAFNINPDTMHSVTVIHDKWNTTLDDFELNLVAIRAKICQEMRDKNALLMVEAAFLDDGVVSMHCQGFSWGLTEDDIAYLNTRFTGVEAVHGFEKGFVAKARDELVGMVAYMFKPPTYAYKKPEYAHAHKTKRLPNRDCYSLYNAIRKIRPEKPLTYFDFMIGVGEGVQMKAAIMEHLQAT